MWKMIGAASGLRSGNCWLQATGAPPAPARMSAWQRRWDWRIAPSGTGDLLPTADRLTQLLPLNKLLCDMVKMVAHRSEIAYRGLVGVPAMHLD